MEHIELYGSASIESSEKIVRPNDIIPTRERGVMVIIIDTNYHPVFQSPVAGDIMLRRVIRQVRERVGVPVISSSRRDVREYGMWHGALGYRTSEIAETWELWNEKTIFLLPNAVYSSNMLREVISCDNKVSTAWVDLEGLIFAACIPRQSISAWIGTQRWEKTVESPDWSRSVTSYKAYKKFVKDVVDEGLLDDKG